jgi:hypothetical protein
MSYFPHISDSEDEDDDSTTLEEYMSPRDVENNKLGGDEDYGLILGGMHRIRLN